MPNKLNTILKSLFYIIILFYLVISSYYFLNKPIGGGDEGLFINDLLFIKENGWIEAIKKRISIPYLLLAYPLSFIFEEHVSLRLVNIILLLVAFYYFFRIDKRTSLNNFIYISFYISTVGFFYSGSNDTLFFLSLLIFINEIYRALNKKYFHLNIALISLIVVIFTRELYLIYLPIIIFGLYVVGTSNFKFTQKLLLPFFIFIFLFFLNIPSLLNNGYLSYDNKKPPENINASWSQRQYLAQLMVNNGDLKNFQHPSWKITQEYIEIHGTESLPDGIIKGIFHDIELTFKEFFKDLTYVLIYSSRSLGLILVINTFVFVLYVYKNKRIENLNFVPIITLIMIFIFSLIIISYVEMRWLAPVFMMSIFYYCDLEKNKLISNYLKYSNILIISIFAMYGIYNILNKIIFTY